jgi:hypothetical protein
MLAGKGSAAPSLGQLLSETHPEGGRNRGRGWSRVTRAGSAYPARFLSQ